MREKTKKSKKRIIILSIILMAVLALVASCVIYFNIYYKADATLVEAYLPSGALVELDDGSLALIPQNARVGFIFYPGAKVEHKAYLPLMSLLYERGIACVIAKMPANFAIFAPNKADKLFNELPTLERWYIGGHSLGGSMACSYASKNADKLAGVILLASYSTEDLSDTDLDIISIYGSLDKVLNMENYQENRTNLGDVAEHIIDGGNHAYFGAYGEQRGDGEAQVTRDEQLRETVQYICDKILADA